MHNGAEHAEHIPHFRICASIVSKCGLATLRLAGLSCGAINLLLDTESRVRSTSTCSRLASAKQPLRPAAVMVDTSMATGSPEELAQRCGLAAGVSLDPQGGPAMDREGDESRTGSFADVSLLLGDANQGPGTLFITNRCTSGRLDFRREHDGSPQLLQTA